MKVAIFANAFEKTIVDAGVARVVDAKKDGRIVEANQPTGAQQVG